jgi:uncharacterized membrane-anchored protein YhcB (DUF1043 family)
MKKLLAYPVELVLVVVLGLLLASPRNLLAQDHVVSPLQMQKDMQAASAAREQNRRKITDFLSSGQAREAMKSAHLDYRQVTGAVSQLSDSDLATLAARSDKARKAFAAGTMSNHDLLLILVGIAALILIIVAVH